MKQPTYWVIKTGPDGTRIEPMTKGILMERLIERDYGDIDILQPDELVLRSRDPNEWPEQLLIIKGEIVAPIATKKVIEYDIE